MPPAPVIDDLLSYARLDGPSLRVVLALGEQAEISGRRVFVRLKNGETVLRFPARLEQTGSRSRIEVTVPREAISDGVWRLKLRDGRSGPLHDLGARVLLHTDQPVALLFGKTANI